LFARRPLSVKYRYTTPSSRPKKTRKYRNVTAIDCGTKPYDREIEPRNGMNIPIKINSRALIKSRVFPIQTHITTDLL
jgi:hypothetical protein